MVPKRGGDLGREGATPEAGGLEAAGGRGECPAEPEALFFEGDAQSEQGGE